MRSERSNPPEIFAAPIRLHKYLAQAVEQRLPEARRAGTLCVAQAADVFGTGVVAGAFVMGSFAIHPAAARLGASAHVLLRQELIRRLARWMSPFMFLPVFASIAAMTVFRGTVLLVLDAMGLALSLVTIGITVAINAPLNRRFALRSPQALPDDWQTYVDRWNTAHSARTTTAFVAVVCAIRAGS